MAVTIMNRQPAVLVSVLVFLSLGHSLSILVVGVYANWPPYRTVIGPQSVIVITVDFSDTVGAFSTESVRDMIFIKISSYFREASYNKTWIGGDVTRKWYQLTGTSADHMWDGKTNPWRYFEAFISSVIRLADDEINYLKYPFVAIVHSGRWRYNFGFVDPYTVRTGEGKLTLNVAIISAYQPEGVFAHEFAHIFGNMPDMFNLTDAEYSTRYVGPWCLMSESVRYLQHLSSWCKIKMGWIPPHGVAIAPWRQNLTVVVDPLELPSPGIHALKIPLTMDTYYLVEVRQKIGFDRCLPDEGVVIYLVDETKTGSGQSVLTVQDSGPETRTRNDAPFDLRPGKPAAFFDRDNDVSIVIVGKRGSSYKIFVGPVGQGEIAVKQSQKFLRVMEAIQEATASIEKAAAEGRTEGIQKAKWLLANATTAFEKGDYETGASLANQAKNAADAAVKPATSVAPKTVTSTETSQLTAFNLAPYATAGAAAVLIIVLLAVARKRMKTKA